MVGTAIGAMLFDEVLEPGQTSPTTRLVTVYVRRSLESAAFGLRIADWAAFGGPDGEQFACLADMVRARLDADPMLAARCETAVRGDDCAVHALRMLAARLEAAGQEGAARDCRVALHILAPVPGRTSLTAVIEQPRPA
jgi:hypothetical protein